ncbi:MAG TPA: His-Xaa-Ser system radical SAM maturase HxsB [Thermoanaerobaculia bacterium]|nr:His-Xaa-Ser system radical SAM maturase HxsB [Thermoanaerobaculia bacterium]
MTSTFSPPETYRPSGGYRLLPFRFADLGSERRLLVNEVGEHLRIRADDLESLVAHTLDAHSDVYLDLKARHFLFDSDSLAPFELLTAKYRTKKSFLDGFTQLHIFVISLRCEHSCIYCQVSRVSPDRQRYDMSAETASRSLDLVFRSPAQQLKIEFQGGEPLLNFPRIREIIEEAERRAAATARPVEFVVTTNLALITDEMLSFFRDHDVFLSTSLDGPPFIHDANRPRPGNDSHARVVENLERSRSALGHDRIAALMTTTSLSLQHPEAIVDEYLRLGFSAIFLRPISPYGFAVRTARTTGYSMSEFLAFYVQALAHILEINRRGTFFAEAYAQLLLRRIFTPFATAYVDLQSPAGAGIGVAVYNYDGNVYASDESRMLAEMNDHRFRLGNVHRDAYEDIFGGPIVRTLAASSVIESLPGCADCAFQPFCGSDPIFHYATQGDVVGHQPTSEFHEKNEFLIKHLLELEESDAHARRIFWSWITPESSS